jgi:hypothetical protein
MTDRDSALAAALDELAALGTDQDREQIAALRDRLAATRLRVLVAGEAKRGKSTLINALLGHPVLPTGVTPLTAVTTTVRYGSDPHAEVRFADGRRCWPAGWSWWTRPAPGRCSGGTPTWRTRLCDRWTPPSSC